MTTGQTAGSDTHPRLRVALCAWEIGRHLSGFGAKVGGLGAVVEELPAALLPAADRLGIDLEITTISPCFGHYDRAQLTELDYVLPVKLERSEFNIKAYERRLTETIEFDDGPRQVELRFVYIWDDWMLHWTHRDAVYPHDPWLMAKCSALIGQGMAGFIERDNFDTVHLHDYHVGLVPFYLSADAQRRLAVHLTVHNGTYQGITPLQLGGGFDTLDRLGLPGHELFHEYFDWFDNLNLMKACMLKVHQLEGKITTVSGDLAGSWGYAAELRMGEDELYRLAWQQKGGAPTEIFLPNRGLDLFEKLPIIGITNGLSGRNRPDRLPELRAAYLRSLAEKQPDPPLFHNSDVMQEMLSEDHTFDADSLPMKYRLKRLLLRECFGEEPVAEPVVLTAVGRLVPQKNLELILPCVGPVLAYEPNARFVVIASGPSGDTSGEEAFRAMARQFPHQFFYTNLFNQPLSRLALAGSDFCLIPSRFEPCGLVDYEASLLGTIVVGRRTGGLAKVERFAYLYDWLDVGDAVGEARAFAGQLLHAIDNFRYRPEHHGWLIREAMAVDAAWDASAETYLRMYEYGLQAREWRHLRRAAMQQFVDRLADRDGIFRRFFQPGMAPYGDTLDWQLFKELHQ